jgi:hypothetical protein
MDAEYNGLTGLELKKLILRVLEKELEGDTNFSQHMTYPQVTFEVKVEIEAYPRSPAKSKVMARGGHREKGFEPKAGEEVVRIEFAGEGPEVGAVGEREGSVPKHLAGHVMPVGPAPDEVRIVEGLPVPRKRIVPGVGVVDAPTG